MSKDFLTNIKYSDIIKRREKFWNSLFEKYSNAEDSDEFFEHSIVDFSTTSFQIQFKSYNLSLPTTKSEFMKKVPKKYGKRKCFSRRFGKKFLLSSDDFEKKTCQIKNTEHDKNVDLVIMNHFLREQQNGNIDLAKLLHVKDIVENSFEFKIEELLKDALLLEKLTIKLSERLTNEEISQYIVLYFKYIKFLEDNACCRSDIIENKGMMIRIERTLTYINNPLQEISTNKPNINKNSEDIDYFDNSVLTKIREIQQKICEIPKENIDILNFFQSSGINISEFCEVNSIIENSEVKESLYEYVILKTVVENVYKKDILLLNYCKKKVLENVKRTRVIVTEEQLSMYVKYCIFLGKMLSNQLIVFHN